LGRKWIDVNGPGKAGGVYCTGGLTLFTEREGKGWRGTGLVDYG